MLKYNRFPDERWIIRAIWEPLASALTRNDPLAFVESDPQQNWHLPCLCIAGMTDDVIRAEGALAR